MQTIITLLLVGVVVWTTIRLAKAYRNKRYSGDIKIIDRIGLDTNVSMLIVKVREQELLLSIGRKEVKLLKEL
ncbi:flagellar biosynthetic protein FliO [Candidatus Margulisiibacteriota bacterium]